MPILNDPLDPTCGYRMILELYAKHSGKAVPQVWYISLAGVAAHGSIYTRLVDSITSSCDLLWTISTYQFVDQLLNKQNQQTRELSRYCSDLYPKAESYRACNWCLREDGGKALPKEAIKDSDSSSPNNSETTATGSNGATSGVKLHVRGASPTQLIKPIKKLRLLNRSASDVTDRTIRREELTPSLARGRQAFRGKVRRYKLLEEVSS